MPKHKLKRLGRRVFKYDVELGKMVEVTDTRRSSGKAPAVILFKEEWYEHIDENPIFITSKKQLKQECEKRGMIAKTLD